MRRLHFIRSFSLAMLVVLMNAVDGSAAEKQIHALLVGVTTYENLEDHHLFGPAKDVMRMAETLEGYEANITTLSEIGGPENRPTRANIQREFSRLAQTVQDGDQVLILLAGHGDRTPNKNPDEDPESDGMDEVFLPRDAKLESGEYVNVVADDDLNDWLTNIRRAGASIVYISDSCHSDSQTRGSIRPIGDGAASRGLDLLARNASGSRGNRGDNEANDSKLDLGEDSGSLVAFFAARGRETTPDQFRAPGTDKVESQGLLTYTICKILKAYPGITYRELGQRIQEQYQLYRAKGINASVPHPTSSGRDLDRIVLSDQWKVGRSRYTFAVKGDVKITGGAIDGLTKGSIMKLLPPAGEGDDVLGWALIDELQSRDSVASLVDYDPSTGQWTKRLSIPESLGKGRCDVELIEYGGQKFSVHLDKSFPSYFSDKTKTDFENLIAELKEDAKSSGCPFEFAETAKADFLLGASATRGQQGGLQPHLVLRTRLDTQSLTPPAVYHFGLIDEKSFPRVKNLFLRISRAKRLVDVATHASGAASRSGRGVRVSVTAEIADQEGGEYKEWSINDGEEIPVGKFIRFRIKNYTPKVVQVTMLYVADDFRIVQLFPDTDEDREISAMKDGVPGEKLIDDGSDLHMASRLNESIVALATLKEDLAGDADYSYLQQSPLHATWVEENTGDEVRGTGWQTTRAGRGRSPLGFLTDVAFKPSVRAGMRKGKVPDHAFSILSFRAAEPSFSPPSFDLDRSTKRIAQGDWEPQAAEESSRGLGKTVFPKVAPAVAVVRNEEGHGTGFFISQDGWLVTNHHVVASTQADPVSGLRTVAINVGKLNESGWMELSDREFLADIYKWSEDKDLALLKIRDPGSAKFPFLRLASKQQPPGSDCVAIGHPAAGSLWLLRSGEVQGAADWPMDQIDVVMARLGASQGDRTDLESYLQKQPSKRVLISSCGCNPGDSGGPLVNEDGEVIAVTFATPMIDIERRVSLDEFSYHVELDELRNFITNKPPAPMLAPPSMWMDPNEGKITTLTNHENSDTLILSVDGSLDESSFAVDLDHDTPVAAYRDAETIDEVKEVWDYEFVLTISASRQLVACYYDTDNDGVIDHAMQDIDRGDGMDILWRLDEPTGRWTRSELTEKDIKLDHRPLVKLLGERVESQFAEFQEGLGTLFEESAKSDE